MSDLLSVIAFVVALFALIALMPDFEGTNSLGWDRQEDDDD